MVFFQFDDIVKSHRYFQFCKSLSSKGSTLITFQLRYRNPPTLFKEFVNKHMNVSKFVEIFRSGFWEDVLKKKHARIFILLRHNLVFLCSLFNSSFFLLKVLAKAKNKDHVLLCSLFVYRLRLR